MAKARSHIPSISKKRLAAHPELLRTGRTITATSTAPKRKRRASTKNRARRAAIAAGARPKRKRAPVSSFNRKYGSRARAKFVRHLPCVYCVALSPLFGRTDGSSQNAHSVGGKGTGYKAGYETIVPMCSEHHKRYDRRLAPFDDEVQRQHIKDCAPRIEAAWQASAEFKKSKPQLRIAS